MVSTATTRRIQGALGAAALASRRIAAPLALILLALAPRISLAGTRGPDQAGYIGSDAAVFSFVDVAGPGGGASVLAGADDGVAALTLPFPFTFYGQARTLACASSNGALYFITDLSQCVALNDFANTDLSSTAPPGDHPALFPFWTDLTFDAPGAGALVYQTLGVVGARRFVVQWNLAYPQGSGNPVTFQLILTEGSNRVAFQYKTVALGPSNPASGGGQATVGIRDAGGQASNRNVQWSFNAPVLSDDAALVFINAVSPPTVATGTATALSPTGATLNGTVNPNGDTTTAVFEYGLTAGYGSQAIADPQPGSASVEVGTSAVVSGLVCATTYHFRLSATNLAGTTEGADQTLVTSACPLPTLSISDVTVAEGASGVANATFMVTLSAASAQTVTVTATTSNLSAVAPTDYTATGPTTLTFIPGVTEQTFAVPVVGDTATESAETFQVTLSNPTNATLLDPIGIGTITNDDLTPPARVFVAAVGSDAADCAVQTTPCRTIAAAMDRVAVDGEVIVLTPGEYETAPLAITKGVKISSPSGTVAFIRQPIIVNAPAGRVVLRGLTLKGVGTLAAVTLTSADSLSIEETTIDGWATGLRLNNPAAAQVLVSNSAFRATAAGINDSGGAALNRVSISETRFEGNVKGIEVLSGAFAVRESAFVGNSGSGLVAGPGSADIQRSEFSFNGTGVSSLSGGTVRMSRSRVFGNGTGLSAAAGSTFASSGTNVVRGNATDSTGTVTTAPEG